MTTENDKELELIPAPVDINTLRDHFSKTYQLNESQVVMMLESSCNSLHHALAQISDIISGAAPKAQVINVYHGLKGLLLNMGEGAWADFAKVMELRVRRDEPCNHSEVAGRLEAGMTEILTYCRKKTVGDH